jgi:hypothetical protein
MIINQTNNKMSSTCATENCSSTVSLENWSEGDAPREYCEVCYQKDQEEEDEDLKCRVCSKSVLSGFYKKDNDLYESWYICSKKCDEEEEDIPKPFDEYAGDVCWIMCFYTKYLDVIWNYYSKEDYWIKHKTDDYFLLIKDEQEKEDPLVCGNVVDGRAVMGCGGKTYPSEQPTTWQHGWWAYCKKCQED